MFILYEVYYVLSILYSFIFFFIGNVSKRKSLLMHRNQKYLNILRIE